MSTVPTTQPTATREPGTAPTTITNPYSGKTIDLSAPGELANATTNDDDSRTYVHPVTGESFPSVTTILGALSKRHLPAWYAKTAVLDIMENLDAIHQAASTGNADCGKDRCGQCVTCLMFHAIGTPTRLRDEAGNRGSRFHHVAEVYALTGAIIPHDRDIAPHINNFQEFLRVHEVQFRATEITVLNRADGWAGTLDGIMVCGWMPPKHRDLIGRPLLFDYKTSNGINDAAGLQLAAYRNAETVMFPDGTEVPLPDCDPTTALSLQINAKGWWVRPVDVGPAGYARFIDVHRIHTATTDPDTEIIGRAMCKPRAKKTV